MTLSPARTFRAALWRVSSADRIPNCKTGLAGDSLFHANGVSNGRMRQRDRAFDGGAWIIGPDGELISQYVPLQAWQTGWKGQPHLSARTNQRASVSQHGDSREQYRHYFGPVWATTKLWNGAVHTARQCERGNTGIYAVIVVGNAYRSVTAGETALRAVRGRRARMNRGTERSGKPRGSIEAHTFACCPPEPSPQPVQPSFDCDVSSPSPTIHLHTHP